MLSLEKTAWAAECAKKEGTTVKRPIEILRSTLDVFLTACNKACEEHKLKSEAHNEFLKYKDYQERIKKCVSDVSERNRYLEKGEEHLGKWNLTLSSIYDPTFFDNCKRLKSVNYFLKRFYDECLRGSL